MKNESTTLREWLLQAQKMHPKFAGLALQINSNPNAEYGFALSGWFGEHHEQYLIGVGADPELALDQLIKQAH